MTTQPSEIHSVAAPSGADLTMIGRDRDDLVDRYVRQHARRGRTIDPASVVVSGITGGGR